MTTIAINPEMTEQEELAQENQRLAAANAAIREIEAKRAGRQRALDLKALEDARNQLAERQSFYEKNLPKFRQQEMDYSNARAHILTARQTVDESQRGRPAVAVFLPGDPEVIRWRKHHDQLEQRLADTQAALRALPDPEVLRLALVYAGEAISQLSYSCQNLQRKLSGETATWLTGGSGVNNVGSSALLGSGKSWIR